MNKQTVRKSIVDSASSIFTKDDVLKLIDSITYGGKITNKQKGTLIEKFEDAVSNNASDIVDYSSAEFDIDGNNTVELKHIDIDESSIRDLLKTAIDDFNDEFEDEDANDGDELNG